MVKEELPVAIRITLIVTGELERLGVPYVVGGSLASSLHGVPRATNDVDIVAALRLEHASPLVSTLGDRFYADLDMIQDAIRHRGGFNLIELTTMFKVDVFVPLLDLIIRKELARGQRIIVDNVSNRSLVLASPEDTVVQKLKWYRDGGCVSEQQRRDIVGVLVTQSGKLDRAYLEETAELLGVHKLLSELLLEAKDEAK